MVKKVRKHYSKYFRRPRNWAKKRYEKYLLDHNLLAPPKSKKILKKEARTQKTKADKIWADLVKEKAGWCCEICGRDCDDNHKGLNAHHILPKERYHEMRHVLKNGVSLCYRCHKTDFLSPHLDAISFANWLKETKPEEYEYLLNYSIKFSATRATSEDFSPSVV